MSDTGKGKVTMTVESLAAITDKALENLQETERTLWAEQLNRTIILGQAVTVEIKALMKLKKMIKGDAEIIIAKRTGQGRSTLRLAERLAKPENLKVIKKAKADSIKAARIALMDTEKRADLRKRETVQRKAELLTKKQKDRVKALEDKKKAEAVKKAVESGIVDTDDNAHEMSAIDHGNLIADNVLDTIKALDGIDFAETLSAVIEKLSIELKVRKTA